MIARSMRTLTPRWLIACLLAALLPTNGAAQGIAASQLRVAIVLTDSASVTQTGIGSIIRGALRGLGDIEIVSVDESYDYLIAGIILPDKESGSAGWNQFAASLMLLEPYSGISLQVQLNDLATAKIVPPVAVKHQQAVDVVAGQWRDFVRIVDAVVVLWGRNRYELAAREWVRKLDERCFEARRQRSRASALQASGDVVGAAAVQRSIRENTMFDC